MGVSNAKGEVVVALGVQASGSDGGDVNSGDGGDMGGESTPGSKMPFNVVRPRCTLFVGIWLSSQCPLGPTTSKRSNDVRSPNEDLGDSPTSTLWINGDDGVRRRLDA